MISQTNNNNNNITFQFCLMTGVKFHIKCNGSEKLSEVVNRLKQQENFNIQIGCLLFQANQLDQNKLISELRLKNDDIILICPKYDNNEINEENKENNNKIKDIKEIKAKYKLNEDEKKMLRKWLAEFKENQLIQDAINDLKKQNKKIIRNIDNNISYEDNKIDFIKQKDDESSSIKVKEHEHELIYIISIFDWKCNCCKKNYSKNDARYYCSLCDFNMCDVCHAKQNYPKKRIFQELDIKPSNNEIKEPKLKIKYHEHNLTYCRSSRNFIGYNTWICDKCGKEFENNIWSFVCTFCDYDLCDKCAKN